MFFREIVRKQSIRLTTTTGVRRAKTDLKSGLVRRRSSSSDRSHGRAKQQKKAEKGSGDGGKVEVRSGSG